MDRKLRVGKLGVALIFLAVFAIVSSASYGLWVLYYRPYTPDEVLLHEHWKPGDVRDVEGVITQVNYFNTTYGHEVYLQLEGAKTSICDGSGFIRGDPTKSYSIGDRIKTTLHFEDYRFGNIEGVWARELICPFPSILRSVGIVIDAVSLVTGFVLVPLGINETGWTTYEIITREGDAYPLNMINASVVKAQYETPEDFSIVDSAAGWIVIAAIDYVALSGGYPGMPVIDEMDSLEDKVSQNGTIRYVDTNMDNLLDDGDMFKVYVDPVQGGFGHQVYLLLLGGGMSGLGYAGGTKYILDGHQGPYDWIFIGDQGMTRLRYAGDQFGTTVTSTLEITQSGNPADINSAETNFTLYASEGRVKAAGRIADLPMTTADGVTVDYLDSNSNSRIDAGDRFTVGGIANRTEFRLDIGLETGYGPRISWISGYGHIVGNIPFARFTTDDLQAPLRINITVPWWHQELNLSKQLTVSLWENSTLVLNNASIADGLIGTFLGGNLTFIDSDVDGFFSTGDVFVVEGNPQSTYKIEVSVLWDYATFTGEFGSQ